MKTNQAHHQENKTETPVEFLSPPAISLKATCDPVPFNDNVNKMTTTLVNKGGGELEQVSVEAAENDVKQAKMMEDVVENLNAVSQPVKDSSSDNAVPQIKKTFQKDKFRTDGGGKVEILYQNSSNNNCLKDGFFPESKAAYYNKLVYGTESSSWKRERIGSGDSEEFRLPSPWKRVAYVAMLLVVGLSCAILAVMKVFGGADWMNTGTFSVIIMGGILLLPPGLYYGHIVICVTCGCKGYSFWDVPQGPFD